MDPRVILSVLLAGESNSLSGLLDETWKQEKLTESEWRLRKAFDEFHTFNEFQFELADIVSKAKDFDSLNLQIEIYLDKDFAIDSLYLGPYLTGAASELGAVIRVIVCTDD